VSYRASPFLFNERKMPVDGPGVLGNQDGVVCMKDFVERATGGSVASGRMEAGASCPRTTVMTIMKRYGERRHP
jgi:hypothetical protein